ncbi:unnamed protein product [Gongylonema pulchrum]|uniref:OmpA-like domain-containing protein n=1 Tax=Gongylonema pulchrum TaxID=637853 RepID=A0A183CY06_9BILA|nr:unnamed protein product [Gongylonema pulchrum]
MFSSSTALYHEKWALLIKSEVMDTSSQGLRKQLNELKDTVERHDTRIAENSQRIEVNGRMAHSFSVRIFGFDFGKYRVESRENDGITTVKVTRPADLFRLLLSDGMRRSENEINSLQIQALHWVGREPHKFMVVRLLTSGDRRLFDSWKRFLSKGFAPHGRLITIRNDPTKMQYLSAQHAKEQSKRLQANGVYAVASDDRIGIGAPPRRLWFQAEYPYLQQLLTSPQPYSTVSTAQYFSDACDLSQKSVWVIIGAFIIVLLRSATDPDSPATARVFDLQTTCNWIYDLSAFRY